MTVLPGVLGCSFGRLPETTLGTGRTGSPCDVLFIVRLGTKTLHAAQAPALRVARPTISRSLRFRLR